MPTDPREVVEQGWKEMEWIIRTRLTRHPHGLIVLLGATVRNRVMEMVEAMSLETIRVEREIAAHPRSVEERHEPRTISFHYTLSRSSNLIADSNTESQTPFNHGILAIAHPSMPKYSDPSLSAIEGATVFVSSRTESRDSRCLDLLASCLADLSPSPPHRRLLHFAQDNIFRDLHEILAIPLAPHSINWQSFLANPPEEGSRACYIVLALLLKKEAEYEGGVFCDDEGMTWDWIDAKGGDWAAPWIRGLVEEHGRTFAEDPGQKFGTTRLQRARCMQVARIKHTITSSTNPIPTAYTDASILQDRSAAAAGLGGNLSRGQRSRHGKEITSHPIPTAVVDVSIHQDVSGAAVATSVGKTSASRGAHTTANAVHPSPTAPLDASIHCDISGAAVGLPASVVTAAGTGWRQLKNGQPEKKPWWTWGAGK